MNTRITDKIHKGQKSKDETLQLQFSPNPNSLSLSLSPTAFRFDETHLNFPSHESATMAPRMGVR